MEKEIFEVLDQARAAGKPIPSIRKVRAMLGGGSLRDILTGVQRWKAAHPDEAAVTNKQGFSATEADELLTKVWAIVAPIIEDNANARAIEKTKQLQDERVLLEQFRTEAAFDLDQAEKLLSEAETLKKKAETSQKSSEEKVSRISQVNRELQKNLDTKDRLLKEVIEKNRELERKAKELQERIDEQKLLIASFVKSQKETEKKTTQSNAVNDDTVESGSGAEKSKWKNKESTTDRTGELF